MNFIFDYTTKTSFSSSVISHETSVLETSIFSPVFSSTLSRYFLFVFTFIHLDFHSEFIVVQIIKKQSWCGLRGEIWANFGPVLWKSKETSITLFDVLSEVFFSGFSFTNIHDSQDSRGRGRVFLYHFHSLHRHS